MSGSVAHIWRHPIKSHGREALERVTIEAGHTMPWDRAWAVTHDRSKADGSQWAPCANFSRAAKTPTLQAITAILHETSETITLTHPDLLPITFQPDSEEDRFLAWVEPLMSENHNQSTGLVRVVGRGMTDSDFASISLNNLASHRAISQYTGQSLSPLRWRGNIWLAGLEPWEEREWVGKHLRVGEVEFEIREEIGRCKATTVNPATGDVDVDTLKALRDLIAEQHFGLYAYPISSGRIALGDLVELL
ncbi:MAG: MOSC N-terminal beta barrel domain-containing protein [Pseudomonadota bacterium]